MMRVLITGAGGFLGSHLVRQLQVHGHEVRACVRNPGAFQRRMPGVEAVQGDFSRDHAVEDWLPRVAGMDAVINAVGIIRECGGQTFRALHTRAPIALFQACEQAGVGRVIQISALGADDAAISDYHLSKKAADDVLARTALAWCILRPSIVYGPGAQSSAFFKALAALPWTPLVGDGGQAMQPIHVADLCRAVLACLDGTALVGQCLDVVGPEAVSLRDLLAKYRRWLGFGAARFVNVPYALALRLARVAGLLGSMPVSADTVAMLQRGNTAPVDGFVASVGFMPACLDRTLAEQPAQQADRWHARLFFLRPLLRISLGVLWVATGLVSAFFFPVDQSLELLAAVGVDGVIALCLLYGAAALDVTLGMVLLVGVRVKAVAWLQIAVMLIYTLMITVALPVYWLHPFGPVTKNLPLLVATLVMIAMEE